MDWRLPEERNQIQTTRAWGARLYTKKPRGSPFQHNKSSLPSHFLLLSATLYPAILHFFPSFSLSFWSRPPFFIFPPPPDVLRGSRSRKEAAHKRRQQQQTNDHVEWREPWRSLVSLIYAFNGKEKEEEEEKTTDSILGIGLFIDKQQEKRYIVIITGQKKKESE